MAPSSTSDDAGSAGGRSAGGGSDRSLEEYAGALADGIEATLPTWVVRSVTTILMAYSGTVSPDALLAAEDAAQRARQESGSAIRSLLMADIDEQRTTPLTLLRDAVRFPTAVLAAAGVPPVERDPFAEQSFPLDVYDLTPASYADIDPSLAEAGLMWGAAKAFAHKARHRR